MPKGLIIALVAFSIFAPFAAAHSNKVHHRHTGGASCVVTPNPAPLGSTLHISISGIQPYMLIDGTNVHVQAPDGVTWPVPITFPGGTGETDNITDLLGFQFSGEVIDFTVIGRAKNGTGRALATCSTTYI